MSHHPPQTAAACRTLVELLRWRAEHEPQGLGYTFLEHGETAGPPLTWGALDAQARAIAATLQAATVPGDRALLLYPQGVAFIAAFFGCLYAGVIGIPVPLPTRRQLQRIQAITASARAAVALISAESSAVIEDLLAPDPAFAAVPRLVTDTIPAAAAGGWREPALGPETLAFLQYTSGSTAAPKGVMVSHANLLHQSAILDRAWEHTPESVIVNWMPAFHDAGLIHGIIQPLWKGIPCYILAPVAFLLHPARWLRAIARYRGTHSLAPDFAYDLCARKIRPEDRATLDLSRWTVALNGAEPVRPETLERFAAAFAPCGFRWDAYRPTYGLAEATLVVSGQREAGEGPVFCTVRAADLEQNRVVEAPAGEPGGRTLVGCGRPPRDVRVVIVHPDTGLACAPDEVGEIWCAGPSVAQGYWGRPEETARTFQAHMAGSGAGPFLRTGDLGFLKDGILFITGRLKDVIIIDGRNHYPQDIEWTAERSHPAIRPSFTAAFSTDIGNRERLIVVAEVDFRARAPGAQGPARRATAQEVTGAVRRAVAEEHDVGVYNVVLIRTGSMPKTSSGKIQRQLCRAGFLAGTLERAPE